MPRDPQGQDLSSLQDIVDSCRLIQMFTKGFDEGSFLSDPKTQSSVIHQLLIIGEAAKRLSPATRDRYRAVPWREIAGMRDRLIHGYHEVDLQEVWDTVVRDVPRLLGEIRAR